ncbi:hypothetical protein NLG97_g8345 [Lecanicillium saksenae]|uniref:Uncharacterized protein n=1 Tax=Lecanicillium saksenae TaxID=468837 RepID=A0ACC1QKT1_9HYPO|nr:hypothetical protein NLG97_g8345 [Lecanicillium saksenae]
MDARWKSANYMVDIFDRTPKFRTAEMIHRHLEWHEGADDNLVSWTSSLLFALVYIFHLHANIRNRTEFQDIQLCVLDTSGLPDDAFIRDMDLVDAFQDEYQPLRDFKNMRRTYYFGEYLSQGALKIEGRCDIITAKCMIKHGLYDIRPEFEEFASWEVRPRPPWANPTRDLRRIISLEKSERPGITTAGLQAALGIAHEFDAPWRLPMAASLIALAAPRTDDKEILVSFRSSIFTDVERRACALQDTTFEGDHMLPEVKEFLDIMKSIYKDYYLNEFKGNRSAPCLQSIISALISGAARLGSAEIALRHLRIFTLSEDFVLYENSATEPNFSLVDVCSDKILGKLRTISSLSDVLHKRLTTVDEQNL